MKTPNLDYTRLADHLVDVGIVDRATIQHVLQQCVSTGALFPELLVSEGLISDWEVSRVCAELFHLPYLPVTNYEPSPDAAEGLDPDYLRQYALVPLDRFGDLLTLSIPGVVPTSVIDNLKGNTSLSIQPVVGSVETNRRWLNEHMAGSGTTLEAFGAALPDDDSSWTNLFDDADNAVKLDLGGGDDLGDGALDLEGLDTNDFADVIEVDSAEAESAEVDAGEIDLDSGLDGLDSALDALSGD